MSRFTLDEATLKRWIGKTVTVEDVLDPRPATLMTTLLPKSESYDVGTPLPPLWHWLYFPTEVALSDLGPDGHPALGDFLPPVPLPRRMWAGGRFEFHQPLRIGDQVVRHSTIKDVALKSGRSGALCFVTVAHDFKVNGVTCLTEQHDIVYKGQQAAPQGASPYQAAKVLPETVENQPTSSVLLFRYSALTFNGHRIHYDVDYCRVVEGYPGLVFHGPLTATLLADLALRHGKGRALKSFAFRAVQPIFAEQKLTLNLTREGETLRLWAETAENGVAMTATAEFG